MPGFAALRACGEAMYTEAALYDLLDLAMKDCSTEAGQVTDVIRRARPSPEVIARTRARCPRNTRFIGGPLRRAAVAAAGLLIACARPVTGGGGGPAAGPPLPPPPARVDDSAIAARDAAALARLDITFGTSGALPQAVDATLAARAARFRAFVRARADQDAFYDTLLPRYFKMIGAAHFPLLSSGMVLASKTEGGRTYYYHPKDGPCASQHQVAVHPWWDLETTVWVCDASYRPDILVETIGNDPSYCEYPWAEPSTCRCGENLINCTRDQVQYDQMAAALAEEPIRTIELVVQRHEPLSHALTMNATVRSDLADFVYARNRAFHTGTLSFPRADPTRRATLRPRDTPYGGGVLTTPAYLYFDDARRIPAATIWDDFLCTPLVSSAVHAEAMFASALRAHRVRFHATPQLGQMTGCQDCHARLESVVAAYSGFTSSLYGMRYVPGAQLHDAIGFYVHDHTDLRGEAPASIQWIGEMIGRQPEFAACLVDRSEQILFGGYPVPPKVHTRASRQFAATQDLAQLIEDLVVARYVGADAQELR